MLTLVLGGAASGKSEYAESLVLRTTGPRWYLATMQIWDAECAARVEKHRKMRAAKQFETVECPLHLGEGTGAVASIPLWDMALAVYGGGYSFAEGGIAPYTPQC